MKVSLTIPYELIARRVETQRGGLLFSGEVKDWTGGTSHVEVRRSGAVHLHATKSGFAVDMPVSVQLDIRRNDPALMNLLKGWSGMNSLRFSLLVSMSLETWWKEGWELDLRITPGFVWQEKPTIGSWVKVDVANWIEPMIQRQLAQAAEELRGQLLRELDIVAMARQVWQQLHQPFSMEGWSLRFEPRSDGNLRSPVRPGPRALHLDLAVPLALEARPGHLDARIPGPLPIPQAGPEAALSPHLSGIRWACSLPLSWLEEMLNQWEGGSVHLRAVALEAAEKSLILKGRLQWRGMSVPCQCLLQIQPDSRQGRVVVTEPRLAFLPLSWTSGWEEKISQMAQVALDELLSAQLRRWETALASWPVNPSWTLAVQDLGWGLEQVEYGQHQLELGGWLQGKVGLRAEEL